MRWRTIRKKSPPKTSQTPKVPYAGFWSRAMGFVTDLFMIGVPVSLIFMTLFGREAMKKSGAIDLLVNQQEAMQNAPDPLISLAQLLLSMVIYVAFWRISMQTPGKKMARTLVVDAKTLERASTLQLVVRFFGYLISAIPLFLGFFTGLFRRDKRTLHDLISRTAVIRDTRN